MGKYIERHKCTYIPERHKWQGIDWSSFPREQSGSGRGQRELWEATLWFGSLLLQFSSLAEYLFYLCCTTLPWAGRPSHWQNQQVKMEWQLENPFATRRPIQFGSAISLCNKEYKMFDEIISVIFIRTFLSGFCVLKLDHYHIYCWGSTNLSVLRNGFASKGAKSPPMPNMREYSCRMGREPFHRPTSHT